MDTVKIELEDIILQVLRAKALEIRNVPKKVTNEEVEKLYEINQPFLYASGNWGPGYVTIKNLVGRKEIIKSLVRQLSLLAVRRVPRLNFVVGNVTGGVIPGWLLSEELENRFCRTVPFVYMRESRKKGGQKELITGIANNPKIRRGDHCLVVEELVNFAQTTCNSAEALRSAGYIVNYAATILYYDNPEANKTLKELGIEMIYLFTLSDLLDAAEKHRVYPKNILAGYRDFLKDPLGWQADRGLTPIQRGGTI